MTTDNTMHQDESLENLTLISLEQSSAELDRLIADSVQCGETLATPLDTEAIGRLAFLLEGCHDLVIFEHLVCSSMAIDRNAFTDDTGSFDACISGLNQLLTGIAEKLENNDIEPVSALLKTELPFYLQRCKAFMSQLHCYLSDGPEAVAV